MWHVNIKVICGWKTVSSYSKQMVKEIKQFNPNFQRQILPSLSAMLEQTALHEVLLHSLQNVQAPSQWGLLQVKAPQLPITLWTLSRVFSYPFSISPPQTFPEQLCSLLSNILHSGSQVQLGPQWMTARHQIPDGSSYLFLSPKQMCKATSEALAEPIWLIYWNDALVLTISLETLNMVQTMTPAQRERGKKMVNTLKLQLCDLI